MNIARKIGALTICFALGVAAGIMFQRAHFAQNDRSIAGDEAKEPSSGAPASYAGSHSRQVQPGDQNLAGDQPVPAPPSPILRLPEKLSRYMMPFIMTESCELDAAAATSFGLDYASAKALAGKINDLSSKFRDLEVANATLEKDEAGNQFFRINTLGSGGSEIKSELSSLIQQAFSKFPDDDRGVFFLQNILKSDMFDDFGATTREISLLEDNAPDGTPGYIFTISRFNNGAMVSQNGDGSKVYLMRSRFGRLLSHFNLTN